MNDKAILLRMSEPMAHWLERAAARVGESRADVARTILKEALDDIARRAWIPAAVKRRRSGSRTALLVRMTADLHARLLATADEIDCGPGYLLRRAVERNMHYAPELPGSKRTE